MKIKNAHREPTKIKSVAKILLNFFFGIAIIWYGVFLGNQNVTEAMNDRTLLNEGHSTRGTITKVDFDIQYGRGAESRKIFEVKYSDNSDRSHIHVGSQPYRTAEEPGQYEVREQFLDQKVTVFYDPEDPSNAVVEGWQSSIAMGYVSGAFLIGFGLVFLLFGVSDTKKFRKNFKKLKP